MKKIITISFTFFLLTFSYASRAENINFPIFPTAKELLTYCKYHQYITNYPDGFNKLKASIQQDELNKWIINAHYCQSVIFSTVSTIVFHSLNYDMFFKKTNQKAYCYDKNNIDLEIKDVVDFLDYLIKKEPEHGDEIATNILSTYYASNKLICN